MIERERSKLDTVREHINDAKRAVFAAQDVASDIADAELLEKLRKARWALEAADRRYADLAVRLLAATKRD